MSDKVVDLLTFVPFLTDVFLRRGNFSGLELNLLVFEGESCDLADEVFGGSLEVVQRGALEDLLGVLGQDVKSEFVL